MELSFLVANTVDDADMGITRNTRRGSTQYDSKVKLLWEALGYGDSLNTHIFRY